MVLFQRVQKLLLVLCMFIEIQRSGAKMYLSSILIAFYRKIFKNDQTLATFHFRLDNGIVFFSEIAIIVHFHVRFLSFSPFSFFISGIGLKYAMMSVKIILAHLLRRYKFTTDLRFEDVEIFTHLVLDIANDRPIRFEERNF